MKTVGDFKKLGGVVVAGDDLHENPTPVAHRWSKEINACGRFDRYTIKSFEWRANVGFAPSFVGEVEYELRNGEKGVCPITMLVFSLLGTNTNPCIKWRPHLDAAKTENPAIKPVFTQEMADAGEFPPVGSEFILSGIRDTCVMSAIGARGFLYTHNDREFYESKDKAVFKSIFDTRTDKEKAIDAAVSCLEDGIGYTDNKHVEFCRILYRAGLLKL